MIAQKQASVDVLTIGSEIHDLIAELYPICRSITGNGVRQTLEIIQRFIPLEVHSVASGITAFDWEVPKEWNITDAYIKNSNGKRVVDFSISNLHVLYYSSPIHGWLTQQELKEHLYTLPEHPDWIPYRTSYYKKDWGFRVTYNQYLSLTDDLYEVCIDSTLEQGYLNYGELLIKGEIPEEVLITTHICHPSLCNDNLSGISVATFLAAELRKNKQRYSYRFIFIPGTIGAITWLSINKNTAQNIKHGLVAVLLGDQGNFSYKKSRLANAEIDEIVEAALNGEGAAYTILEYSPYGYDERQFCSPGFNLPVGCLSRTPYNQYPEYHTSADNLDFVKAEPLQKSLEMLLLIVSMLEKNKKYLNTNPMCEPNLGKRGLYNLTGNDRSTHDLQLAILWVLSLSDGTYSLLQISRKSKIAFGNIVEAASQLTESGLLIELQTD